jgi:hypothetical protein
VKVAVSTKIVDMAKFCGFLFFFAMQTYASDTTPSPVVFNFFPSAQTSGPDQSVIGFRGNFFYGENKNMYGADLGIFVSNTKETFAGVALAGLLNITGKQAYIAGLQLAGLANVNRGKANVFGFEVAGLFNEIKEDGSVYGVQLAALANYAPKTNIHGLQLGLYNKAQTVVGLQIGLFNFTDNLHGIQIGVLNFYNRGLIGVTPLFNIGFL